MITFVFSLFAFIVCALLYKLNNSLKNKKIGMLALFYAGASLMWLVDIIFEFAEDGIEAFEMTSEELLNESFLGLTVLATGVIAWTIILLISHFKEKKVAA